MIIQKYDLPKVILRKPSDKVPDIQGCILHKLKHMVNDIANAKVRLYEGITNKGRKV